MASTNVDGSVANINVGSNDSNVVLTSSTAYLVTTGFQPRYIQITNGTHATMYFYEGMADSSALKTDSAGLKTVITTNGFSVSDSGFTFGADTTIVVTGDTIFWMAIG